MKNHTPIPPPLAKKFLNFFLKEDLAEEVLGDLDEQFSDLLKKRSPFRAKLKYWYQAFNYVRPFAFKKYKFGNSNHFAMLQNYYTVAWRNLARYKMYSAIKIGGFAIGIAACFLITLFIRDETSYDKHYANADRIYRLIGVFNDNGNIIKDVWFPAPFSPALKEDYAEVEKSGRFNPSSLFGAGENEIRRSDRVENLYEKDFTYIDQSLLEILEPKMIHGKLSDALVRPNSIVITRKKSEKFFPGENPIGKTFILNNDEKREYLITAVIEDFPKTSHISYEFFISLTEKEFWPGEQKAWNSSNYPTYVLLKPGVDADELAKKMTKGTIEKYFLPAMIAAGQTNAMELKDKAHLELQPITDIHLYSEDIHDFVSHGDIRFVWIFGSIAGFILLIACINFINLSTAKSANRAKEVGLRKVVGSHRANLVNQFLTESLLFSALSFVIGILLAWALLPYFNIVANKSLALPWKEWWFVPTIAGSMLAVGTIAGLYPSFYLSSFRPIEVIKGNLSRGSKRSGLRSALVMFQFTASIILIVSTVVVHRQMDFILHTKLGFDKDQVLLLQGTGTLGNKMQSFKNELLKIPSVKSASVTDYIPVSGTMRNGNSFYNRGRTTDHEANAQFWRVDEDYISTMGIELAEGRNFNIAMPTDSQSCVVNRQLLKELGIKNPLGTIITNGTEYTIVGVVEDFHFESMKEKIGSVVMVLGSSPGIVSVKLTANADTQTILKNISSTWDRFSDNQAIRFTFLDQSYARMYEGVRRTEMIFQSFSVLAIAVACLGLFALSAFMVEQRQKEMSIRIVLGAPGKNIFRLLTQDFIILVLASFVVAVPIGWYFMNTWLEDYEYKIQLSWDIFFLAGLTAVAIALITISYQSLKAARMNPVNSLRSN